MEAAQVRSAVEAAGRALWNPEHLGERELGAVEVDDVVALPVGWLAIGHADDVAVSAPLLVDGGDVRRARPGDGVVASLLRVLAAGGTGPIEAVHVTGDVPAGGSERWMGVDQSNESYVVAEAVVVKLFPRASAGAHPAVDIPAHLAATGFTETPASLGALRWRDDVLLATVTAYVPGARDGWEWYVELVEHACHDDGWAQADAPAPLIGALVARMHRALATPSEVIEAPTDVAGASTIETWHARAAASLREAVDVTPDEAGERLRRLAPRAESIIDRLLRIDATPIQRVHGDLHVGQILRDEAGALWVNDFDGNPLAPVEDRTAKDATARDVAAMAGAIDHVGRVVTRRVPDAHDAVADWIERARASFLTAYRAELGDDASLYDRRLLHPFAVAQEAHEYCYAASYLPRWRYVPDVAMPAAIARAETDL